MPLEIDNENPNYMTIRASGKLNAGDYKIFVPEFERIAPHDHKLRMLFDMTGLEGWDPAAAWEDLKFDVKHFNDIERLAIIGDKPWQHGVTAVFAPFIKAKTRYFDPGHAAEAGPWLSAK